MAFASSDSSSYVVDDDPQIFVFPMKADSSSTCTLGEKNLLDSFLATLTNTDDDSTFALLELNCENESCRKLLSMWNR